MKSLLNNQSVCFKLCTESTIKLERKYSTRIEVDLEMEYLIGKSQARVCIKTTKL